MSGLYKNNAAVFSKIPSKTKKWFQNSSNRNIFADQTNFKENIVEDIRNNYDYRVNHTANLPAALPIHPANRPL